MAIDLRAPCRAALLADGMLRRRADRRPRCSVLQPRRWLDSAFRRLFLRSARRVTPERLRWALRIRGAVIVLFLVVAIAGRLGGVLPALGPALAGAVAGAVMNAAAERQLRRWRHIPALIALTGAGDAIIITGVVLATGGTGSPFLFLYVVQVLTAALVVGLPTATFGGLLGVGLLTAGAWAWTPLATWAPPEPPRAVGLLSLVLTLAFLVFIGGRLTRRLARSERELMRAHRRLRRSWRRLSAAHAELQTAYASLERAEARLVAGERMRMLELLVAGVAHELGNPLSVLAGNLEPVETALGRATRIVRALAALVPATDAAGRREAEDLVAAAAEERREMEDLLANCREAAGRAVGLLGQLKSFGRGRQGQGRGPAAVRDALASTLALVRHRLPPEVRVEESYADVPDVMCVAAELKQVFMNLLLNAADALRPGGTLGVTLRRTDAEVEVAIEDDGTGIPSDVLPRLFEPFFTTKEAGKGTGLGLAISHAIVARHGGRLEAGHREGGGARFTVRLPIGGSDALVRGQDRAVASGKGGG